MNTVEVLAALAGIGALAGLNLYLTVFVLSLFLRMGWLDLGQQFMGLELLTHPAVFYTAGALAVVEFFADKIPWFDSFWDAVHTLIRPAGAAVIGFTALGDVEPIWAITAAMVTGGVGLAGHTAKAGARLAINASPEPLTNSAASFTENALVVAGLTLWAWAPWIALIFLILLLTGIVVVLWLVWKVFRRVIAWRPRFPRPPQTLRENTAPAEPSK
ncbi:MAG: DUF4126 domain-containing protein [Candidatus Methylacidiphilales bacterium]